MDIFADIGIIILLFCWTMFYAKKAKQSDAIAIAYKQEAKHYRDIAYKHMFPAVKKEEERAEFIEEK